MAQDSRKKFESSGFAQCTDIFGETHDHGQYFTPPSSVCDRCKCKNGKAGLCIGLQCQKPRCKNYKQVHGKCCEYTCPNASDLTDKTTLAAVVSLSLLLIIILVAIFVVWRKTRMKKMFGKRLDSVSSESQQDSECDTTLIEQHSIPNNLREQSFSSNAIGNNSPPRQSSSHSPQSSRSGTNKTRCKAKTSENVKRDSCKLQIAFTNDTQNKNKELTSGTSQHEITICCKGDGCCRHETRRFEPPPPYFPPSDLTFV